MKFDDIDKICIYTRKTKIESSSNFIVTDYDYYFLEKNDIDKIYKFDKVIDNILNENLRFCIFAEDFSEQVINKITNRIKVINKNAYNHFKYNMDLRFFTKNFDTSINQNLNKEDYYFLADSIYDFYENRFNFINIKNCLIFIDEKEKFENIINNQQILIKYFKNSNVDELILILMTNDDMSLLKSFTEVNKNKYIYEEDTRKIIIKTYDQFFLFNEVNNGI